MSPTEVVDVDVSPPPPPPQAVSADEMARTMRDL